LGSVKRSEIAADDDNEQFPDWEGLGVSDLLIARWEKTVLQRLRRQQRQRSTRKSRS
jgi:hypothetical protein